MVLLSAKVWCKSAVMSWLIEECVLLLIAWLVSVIVKCDNLLANKFKLRCPPLVVLECLSWTLQACALEGKSTLILWQGHVGETDGLEDEVGCCRVAHIDF